VVLKAQDVLEVKGVNLDLVVANLVGLGINLKRILKIGLERKD